MENTMTTEKTRAIGDIVWVPQAKSVEVWEQCPDCLGTARWRVVLPSGEEFACECPRCYHGGFAPSDGRVCERHEVTGCAVRVTINRIEAEGTGIRYNYSFGPEDVFDDEPSALARSVVKAREWWDHEDDRMREMGRKKCRPKRDREGKRESNDIGHPAGNVNYARDQVRRAIKDARRWIDHAARHGTAIDLQAEISRAERAKGAT